MGDVLSDTDGLVRSVTLSEYEKKEWDAADCYTWLGDDEPAEEHAREIIAYHTRADGSSNAPMRSANSHMDLAVIRARHGNSTKPSTTGTPPSATTARPKPHSYPGQPTSTAS